jgi:hypothetical protein
MTYSQNIFMLVLFWLLAAAVAQAQPMSDVVVIPVGAPDVGAPLAIAASLESELAEAEIGVIPLHDARDRFTARSRPPQTASNSDLDVLARAAHDAIEHVAFGRTAAAQKSVREVISRAEGTLESLNRETATARHILDACLSLVRSALQIGKRDLALEQATRCRRLVPDLAPSAQAHPVNVVGVLAEADNLLRRMHTGQLKVRSAPESGCSVYLNGRHLGTTPFRLDRAAAGDYRVQVECGRNPARVHIVQLGDQPVSLAVDTELDRAVASEPRLLLRYETAKAAGEQAVSHAIQVGREIGATDVILLGVRNEAAELLRVQVEEGRLVARATVSRTQQNGFPKRAIERAITALAEGRVEVEPGLVQVKELESGPNEPSSGTERESMGPTRFTAGRLLPQTVEPSAASADRGRFVAKSDEGRPASASRSDRHRAYKKWWVWTTIGLVASAGILTTVLLRRKPEPEPRAVQGTNTTGVSLKTLAQF